MPAIAEKTPDEVAAALTLTVCVVVFTVTLLALMVSPLAAA